MSCFHSSCSLSPRAKTTTILVSFLCEIRHSSDATVPQTLPSLFEQVHGLCKMTPACSWV